MRLRTIPIEKYAGAVLPVTASLWAGQRDLQTYVRQTNELARSSYGRRNYRTVGLFEDNDWLASCKRYERTIDFNGKRLRAVGFGAVFTPQALRGQGYATTMLALLMDEARQRRLDLGYLFSDIHPAFYAALGFQECPSHTFTMASDSLPTDRVRSGRIEDSDWRDVARCFRALESAERWRIERSAAVWDWIRVRVRQRAENRTAQMVALAVRAKRRVIAYVIGQRQPLKDVFMLDELGWNGSAGRAAVAPLLRNAAGDLRRISGWLPPSSAIAPLHRYRTRKRTDAILMMAPLSARARHFVEVASGDSATDAVWSTDHI
ncbi:MAG: GNAT family N-acetyltransferase [Candidatus Eremiobacteraeota bacterium]|nr:GNAT family N-acetyltransferase [Candidatus Eremiobacteraeota bacterium]